MNMGKLFGNQIAGIVSGIQLCAVSGALLLATVNAHAVDTVTCPSGNTNYLPGQSLLPPGMPVDRVQPDLKVVGECLVRPGSDREYFYGQVNILDGGELLFREYDEKSKYQDNTVTNFWASAIIIENGGAMDISAGDDGDRDKLPDPYGEYGGTLNIYLYGKDDVAWDDTSQVFTEQNQGALCISDIDDNTSPCGIPEDIWTSNGSEEFNLPGLGDRRRSKDYFYQYGPLYADSKCSNGEVFSNGECGAGISADGKVGYFGKKVLAVSYGGSLDIAGYKGACTDSEIKSNVPGCNGLKADDEVRSAPGWTRLGANMEINAGQLTLESVFKGAEPGDEIIVTTTDYLPGHSELLKIESGQDGKLITLQPLSDPCSDDSTEAPCFFHQGERFPLEERLDKAGGRLTIDDDLVKDGAEIRAAVAHVTRSVRIISAGDAAGDFFPAPDVLDDSGKPYSFGGQLIARQGFQKLQIQGVEFVNLGQGGRLGHYPVHFHKARETPKGTFVKDSSINVSNTRWIVLHSTQGVELERNIGYKSIGHGFYLEEGTETDNSLHSNLGIFARAAVENSQNPRKIPGILADNEGARAGFPFRSDSEYPSAFWITNGWNDFIGNMAAGAGACGAAYWFVPTQNSDRMDVGSEPMKWSGYSQLQKNTAGISPVRSFYMNYATSAMHSLQTTSDAPVCQGFLAVDQNPVDPDFPVLRAARSIAPKQNNPVSANYFPKINFGDYRKATVCPGNEVDGYDCNEIVDKNLQCANSELPISDPDNTLNICAVTVFDHFTSSFHWAQGNVSAIWLRSNWFLLSNSVLTDIQNGGLTFITGGDYTHSSVIKGYWSLARNSIFIGETTPKETGNDEVTLKNPYASDAGPFNKQSGLQCDPLPGLALPNYCLNSDEGISMPVDGFFTNQRFANIYDGPSYQDSNVYLDITKTRCEKDGYNSESGCMYGAPTANLILKVKDDATDDAPSKCWLPNAAIAWKQPNGFYYPPAFHSDNLFFDNIDLRHFVINPMFKAPDGVTGSDDFGQGGTYLTDEEKVQEQYCNPPGSMFTGWTAVDRQTELSDDDGTLTGLINTYKSKNTIEKQLNQTISVNDDLFFSGPVEAPECLSALGPNTMPDNACSPLNSTQPPPTVKTSPYDYVSTVLYHVPANPSGDPPSDPDWNNVCTNPKCYGVPLYRQYLTGENTGAAANSTRDWKHWYDNKCDEDPASPQCRWPFIRMSGAPGFSRQTMTVNNGTYYVDTTISRTTQETDNSLPPLPPGPNEKRSVNVFMGGETYHMFFVYGKQTTKQTYQFYVGEDFDEDTFKLECVTINTAALEFTEASKGRNSKCKSDTRGDWASAKTSKDDSSIAPGILEVVVDFEGQTDLDPTIANGLCLPRTFCQPDPGDSTSCIGALTDDDPVVKANSKMKAEADAVCKKWAVKDLDCPEKGCLGFAFVMPAGFEADGSYHRPDPEPFPTSDDRDDGKPFWSVEFKRTNLEPDSDSGGQCYYPELPGTDCAVP